jgi:hypothetical protein
MKRVVAVLETMWDWRAMTSGAGYKAEAPRYFPIHAENFSGRLYRFIGPEASLLVTNACRDLVPAPNVHGTPDAVWLAENLRILDGVGGVLPGGGTVPHHEWKIDLLLICGSVAQETFSKCGYKPRSGRTILMPHPAMRRWTEASLRAAECVIQCGNDDLVLKVEGGLLRSDSLEISL